MLIGPSQHGKTTFLNELFGHEDAAAVGNGTVFLFFYQKYYKDLCLKLLITYIAKY